MSDLTGFDSVRQKLGWNFLLILRGDAERLLRNTIQKRRGIPSNFSVKGMRIGKVQGSHGNRVNVGNFNRNGLNVNNDQPDWDNNDNLRVSLAWNFHPKSKTLFEEGFRLLQRSSPATKHTAYFINHLLKAGIFC